MVHGLIFRVLAAGVCLACMSTSSLAQTDPLSVAPLVLAESTCVVEARSVDDLRAVLSSPAPKASADEIAAVAAVLGNDRGQFAMPEGEAADKATVARITETLTTVYSCLAAGDQLAAASLMTDDWLRAQLMTNWTVANTTPSATAATPIPNLVLASRMNVGAVRNLEGGRVGALVQIALPDGARRTDFVLLDKVDGRWLVTELVDGVTLSATPPP